MGGTAAVVAPCTAEVLMVEQEVVRRIRVLAEAGWGAHSWLGWRALRRRFPFSVRAPPGVTPNDRLSHLRLQEVGREVSVPADRSARDRVPEVCCTTVSGTPAWRRT